MPVSISQVEGSHPEALVSSGADIGNRASTLSAQMDQQRAIIDRLRASWTGTSSDAAIASATASLERMQRLHERLTKLQSVLHNGGAIVGTAEQMGLRADRILHASSAATGILSGEYTNPNPDVQRYSMTAPGDLISVVQSLPRDASDQQWVDKLPWIPHTVDGQVGHPLGGLPSATDPDKIPGVTRLDTGYYGREGEHANEVIVGRDSHGKYWDDYQSDAFHNMVAVISGGEATGYVERGIETNYVDIDIGDDGNFRAESSDQARANGAPYIPELPWDDDGSYERRQDPWDNPRVTDNPDRGPRIQIK